MGEFSGVDEVVIDVALRSVSIFTGIQIIISYNICEYLYDHVENMLCAFTDHEWPLIVFKVSENSKD